MAKRPSLQIWVIAKGDAGAGKTHIVGKIADLLIREGYQVSWKCSLKSSIEGLEAKPGKGGKA